MWETYQFYFILNLSVLSWKVIIKISICKKNKKIKKKKKEEEEEFMKTYRETY